jgi:aspartyl/asparaginyl-tRNA synthetase
LSIRYSKKFKNNYMAKVFISFRGEDEFKVNTLRGLAQFKNVEFEMDDVSLRKAIESREDNYIKGIIRLKINKCDICLCMIGENTHRSRKWIPWEIGLAIELKKPILAMRFKDSSNAITPNILLNKYIRPFDWDLNKLIERIG